MSNEVSIQDLPDEMLEKILLQLRLEDCKSALRVCKRWSALKPFDFSSVQLKLDRDFMHEDYLRALLASSRQYKHLKVRIPVNFEYHEPLLEILSSFSQSAESLELQFSFFDCASAFRWILFAKIVNLLPKLKHLAIYEGEVVSTAVLAWLNVELLQNNLEFLPKELYIKYNQLISITDMQEMTPNITRLQLHIFSEESINFLRDVSSRLVQLEILYQSEDKFLAVCTMQFPLLEKLSIVGSGTVVDCRRTAPVDRFFQQLPRLKGLTIYCFKFEHLGNLCQWLSCGSIQFLCLGNRIANFNAHDLLAICRLKHLKCLRIMTSTINVPTIFDFPRLESLHVLSLDEVKIADHVEFTRFCRYAFPNIAVFEMLGLRDDGYSGTTFEQYEDICSNMPPIQRLVLNTFFSIQLGPLLEFCASQGPRELRIACSGLLDDFPLDEPSHSITVPTLILDVPAISLTTLHQLIQSMGKLKRLELPQHIFRTMGPDASRSLRDAFPRCEVIVRRKVQIEEPL